MVDTDIARLGGTAIGTYAVAPARLLARLTRHPQLLTAFTGPEMRALLRTDPLDPLACARHWAVKEAVLRAVAAPPGLRARRADVEVTGPAVRPRVRLRGQVAAHARARRVRRLDVFVRAHGDRLVATAVCSGGSPPARRCDVLPLRPGGLPAARTARPTPGGTR